MSTDDKIPETITKYVVAEVRNNMATGPVTRYCKVVYMFTASGTAMPVDGLPIEKATRFDHAGSARACADRTTAAKTALRSSLIEDWAPAKELLACGFFEAVPITVPNPAYRP